MLIRSVAITVAALGLAAISDAEARRRNGPSPPPAKAPGKVVSPYWIPPRLPPKGAKAPKPLEGKCPISICGVNGKSLDGSVLGGAAHLGSGAIQGVLLPGRDAAR